MSAEFILGYGIDEHVSSDTTIPVLQRKDCEKAMSDLIHIDDLHVRAIIGINPDERINLQDVYISLTIETDTRAAAASDDIADAVNYRTLTKDVFEMTERSQFLLVERLADEIATLCLRDDRISAVRVRVDKPGALRFARSVAVEIERSQSSE